MATTGAAVPGRRENTATAQIVKAQRIKSGFLAMNAKFTLRTQ